MESSTTVNGMEKKTIVSAMEICMSTMEPMQTMHAVSAAGGRRLEMSTSPFEMFLMGFQSK